MKPFPSLPFCHCAQVCASSSLYPSASLVLRRHPAPPNPAAVLSPLSPTPLPHFLLLGLFSCQMKMICWCVKSKKRITQPVKAYNIDTISVQFG